MKVPVTFRVAALLGLVVALAFQSGRFGLRMHAASAPVDVADRLRAACAAGGSHRMDVGPAVILVTVPRGAELVTRSPDHPTLEEALNHSVRSGRSLAFNVQFQTVASDFRQTRGATLEGDTPLHPLPSDDPTLRSPSDFATLEAIGPEPVRLRLVRGPPEPRVEGRVFAMGGLFPLREAGMNVDSWYVDGQEEGHAFVAQAKGKMLLALGNARGCVAVAAHPNVVLDGATAWQMQQNADEVGLLTFSAWRDLLGSAGFADILALDSGISPHLVVSGEAGEPEVLVHMDPSAVPVLRYGARIAW
jgi:hypothetical protein